MGFAGIFSSLPILPNGLKKMVFLSVWSWFGPGSLVAYSLKITDLDPLALKLLFERFLNQNVFPCLILILIFVWKGVTAFEYVMEKHGHDSVSQIITYGTMAAKAVVRDVGRVLALGYGFVDKIAKLIPFELGITLDKAMGRTLAA